MLFKKKPGGNGLAGVGGGAAGGMGIAPMPQIIGWTLVVGVLRMVGAGAVAVDVGRIGRGDEIRSLSTSQRI